MGISKAMMEKVMVAKSRNLEPARTVICGTRYGNVMASAWLCDPVVCRSGVPQRSAHNNRSGDDPVRDDD